MKAQRNTRTPSKPVKLQINTSGTWRDVVSFDAANDAVGDQVMDGAAELGKATNSRFRVVMKGSLAEPLAHEVLVHFDPAQGWKAVTT